MPTLVVGMTETRGKPQHAHGKRGHGTVRKCKIQRLLALLRRRSVGELRSHAERGNEKINPLIFRYSVHREHRNDVMV